MYVKLLSDKQQAVILSVPWGRHCIPAGYKFLLRRPQNPILNSVCLIIALDLRQIGAISLRCLEIDRFLL